MDVNKVQKVRIEVDRFISKLEDLEKLIGPQVKYVYSYPRETGAVRRASMDLTRALADLRRY